MHRLPGAPDGGVLPLRWASSVRSPRLAGRELFCPGGVAAGGPPPPPAVECVRVASACGGSQPAPGKSRRLPGTGAGTGAVGHRVGAVPSRAVLSNHEQRPQRAAPSSGLEQLWQPRRAAEKSGLKGGGEERPRAAAEKSGREECSCGGLAQRPAAAWHRRAA